MRSTIRFLPLCVAGSLLLSCVTTHVPKAPVVEVFDSVAMTPSAQERLDNHLPLIEPSIAGLPLAAPLVKALAGPVADEARAVSPAQSPSTVPARKPFTSTLPESPGLIPLGNPRTAVRFPLAAPEAPPIPARKQTPPSTRQSSAQPPKASANGAAAAPKPVAAAPATPRRDAAAAAQGSASGTSGTTATAGTGAPVSGTVSPAPAVPAPGATRSPNGPAESYGRLREIYARQGDELQVGLDGSGFLFLGFPDRSQLADGMSFKGKEIRNNKTWFTFRALKLGTYDLDFLMQENTTGKSDKETVRVHVVTEQDFSAAVNPPSGQGGADTGAVETADTEFAGRLTNMGAYASALAELQKGYREGNPGLNDQIASLYMRMGSYDAAGKYYSRNLVPPNEYSQRAVVGLVSIATAQKDQKALMASLKQFLAIKDPSVEEPLIRAIRMEANRAEIGLGLDLAGEYAARYPNGRWRDEADFLMANLLEGDSQFRDIARARELYRGILASDPESTFAAAAREHLSYIDRHFYQVR
jgi:tetratricopeptide (TPR) repeat protein